MAGAIFVEVGGSLLLLRIVNDVSYVRRINHEIFFVWQAQCDFSWQAQHFLILGDSRIAKCCFFDTKIVSKIGRVMSLKLRVRVVLDWYFVVQRSTGVVLCSTG